MCTYGTYVVFSLSLDHRTGNYVWSIEGSFTSTKDCVFSWEKNEDETIECVLFDSPRFYLLHDGVSKIERDRGAIKVPLLAVVYEKMAAEIQAFSSENREKVYRLEQPDLFPQTA